VTPCQSYWRHQFFLWSQQALGQKNLLKPNKWDLLALASLQGLQSQNGQGKSKSQKIQLEPLVFFISQFDLHKNLYEFINLERHIDLKLHVSMMNDPRHM
jgi:hypothetical protein